MSAAEDELVPRAVLEHWRWGEARARPLGGGLINQTYAVDFDGEIVAVLQRLHPIFSGEVCYDLEAVSNHLRSQGLTTPTLIRAADGQAWCDHDDGTWRAISFVAGRCVDRISSRGQAEAAGELVGRVHSALDGFNYSYRHVREGVHDLPAYIEKLRQGRAAGGADDAGAMSDEILTAARGLPELGTTPLRHCHGDLKISNLLFDEDEWKARSLIDLDTFGRQPIAFELGDAMRSWCNLSFEDDPAPRFNLTILESAMSGYAAGSRGLLGLEEVNAIAGGIERICVELACRFAADIYWDCYFGWDASRFPSRAAHNRARAGSQLALAREIAVRRSDIDDIIRRCFSRR